MKMTQELLRNLIREEIEKRLVNEQEEVCEKCGKSPCECDETEESIEQAISANKNDVTITRFKENKEDLDELIKEIILSTITKNK